MDTPTIAQYYREADPMARQKLLQQSIEAGEEPENNAIRQEIWEIRYQEPSQVDKASRADGYLKLWMALEFNKNYAGKLFAGKGAQKEISGHLKRMKFEELAAKGPQYEELLYRECCHLVRVYMDLCATDRTYNSTLFGIMPMKKEHATDKMKADIYQTAIKLPRLLGMEQELSVITRAAREMYRLQFPEEKELE